jgi:hypothetical protein
LRRHESIYQCHVPVERPAPASIKIRQKPSVAETA